METELADLDGLKKMNATAAENYAGVALEFEFGWDKTKIMADVRDAMNKAETKFPNGADKYSINEFNFSEFPVIIVNSTGKVPERTMTQVAKGLQEKLESMDNNSNLEDFSENFNPPSNPSLTKQGTDLQETYIDSDITPENFQNLNASEARNQEYYNQFVPYYKQATNNANIHGSKDELMEKLNYIVQVLEETKDEKTENISEELVLYMFLGVFVIFVVDSFAKAGKYTR